MHSPVRLRNGTAKGDDPPPPPPTHTQSLSYSFSTAQKGEGGREIVSGCIEGWVTVQDVRRISEDGGAKYSTRAQSRSEMTCMKMHPKLPVLATGSIKSFINVSRAAVPAAIDRRLPFCLWLLLLPSFVFPAVFRLGGSRRVRTWRNGIKYAIVTLGSAHVFFWFLHTHVIVVSLSLSRAFALSRGDTAHLEVHALCSSFLFPSYVCLHLLALFAHIIF